MKDKRLHKFIAITLCVTLLTISASRVTRVSAVATSIAAVAGAATVAVGIGFLSYCALSGMAIHCPNTVDAVREWAYEIGTKVKQYPSGSRAYDDMYQQMLNEPVTGYLSRAWDWTVDKLLDFANDFADTRIISNIVTYSQVVDLDTTPLNGFSYVDNFTITTVPDVVHDGGTVTSFEALAERGFAFIPYSGVQLLWGQYDTRAIVNSTLSSSNLYNYFDGESYSLRRYINGNWTLVNPTNLHIGYELEFTPSPGTYRYLFPNIDLTYWAYGNTALSVNFADEYAYPIAPNIAIYDATTDEFLPLVEPVDIPVEPEWPDVLDPDEEVEYPIVPYVQFPYDVYGGGGNPNPRWGFDLEDLLDILGDLGETIFDILVLKELLNRYAGDHSGDSYIYYDYSENGTTYNNYNYFTTANYGDDYVTYNIDVSDTDEHLPVDLNTIQLYTNNRYLDEVKRSALAGGSIIRDLVVFWYDVDPTIIYIFFGSCIAILVAAFIGKWGHS